MPFVLGATLIGVEGRAIEVEVRISSQLPRIDVVGLPEASVRESAARVRAAIQASGHKFPDRRVTVNLAPAELRKQGAGLDLGIAVGILAADGKIAPDRLPRTGFVGELALDGRLRGVRGALALCVAARDAGCERVIVPVDSAAEAALAPGVRVLVAPDLPHVIAWLQEAAELAEAVPRPLDASETALPDVADVRGQEHARRALEIAAAGGHALFMRGAPGCGKTMLARRLQGLLPPLDFDEALEVTQIHGAAGLLSREVPIVATRPFRAPHHSASVAGLLGGGSPPRPGEASLAHRGVLFLDELPEFPRQTLESLRQVLEAHRVVIARARMSCTFPAHFQLVAAANPCPCGWYGSGVKDCRCDELVVSRYDARISGPLLDRIDLHVSLRPVPWRQLDARATGPTSADVRARVIAARARQSKRSRGRIACNAGIPDDRVDAAVAATAEARELLGRAVEKVGLSARAARRVLKVARTIADLSGESKTSASDVAEALGYRPGPS
jgi:magnesium chelatase family protein